MSQTRRCTDQCHRPGGVRISATDKAVYRSVPQTRRCTDQCHRPGGVHNAVVAVLTATDRPTMDCCPITVGPFFSVTSEICTTPPSLSGNVPRSAPLGSKDKVKGHKIVSRRNGCKVYHKQRLHNTRAAHI